MAIETLADFQYPAPSAADGVELTVSGVAWANTAWGEVIAATDADCILSGIEFRPLATQFDGYRIEVDVGVGPAASEVVIATFLFILHEVFANIQSEACFLPTFIGVDNIPSGSRVSMRWRASTTVTPSGALSLTYYKKPLTGTYLSTVNPLLVFPEQSSPLITAVTGTGGWEDGAAVEIFDNSGPSRAIVGFVTHLAQANTEWEVDFLLGDEADVLATTIHASRGGVSSFPNFYPLPNPLVIPELTTFSAKARQDNIDAVNVEVGIVFFEMPLS